MQSPINKHTLEHLAKLARIELDSAEEEKLLADLRRILDYFRELQALDTTGTSPMPGGTKEKNIFREDGEREKSLKGDGKEALPETREGFLKVPPVFSAEGGSPLQADGPRAHASGGE